MKVSSKIFLPQPRGYLDNGFCFLKIARRFELPIDFRIPTVAQKMTMSKVMDEVDSEGEIHR